MSHVHEKIDFTSEVFVVHKNKVLLRVHDKMHIWLSVGGHIEPDEDPNEAAVREVKEEVGLDVKLWSGDRKLSFDLGGFKELIPPVSMNRHRVSASHEHITLVYFATSETDEIILSQTEKTSDCRWFAKEELAANDIKPHIRHLAKLALDTLAS